MNDRIQIIEYLPSFVAGYKEIKQIMLDNQQELDPLWDIHAQVLDNNFVLDSDEYGVKRYEKIVGVLKKPNQSLADRKFAILLAMNKELPYTIRTLRNTLTSILGDERLYSLEVVNNDYLLMFELKAEFQNKLKEIVKMLREVVPANMGIASRLTMHQTAPIFLAAHTTTAMHVTVLPYIPQPIHQSTNASVGAFLTIASHIKVLPFIAKSISDSTGAQFRAFQKSGQRFTIKPN